MTSMTSSDGNETFRCCDKPYSAVTIEIQLKRKPLFYLLYTLLPLIALILTFLLIFHLDIGQRSSYGVTILLSITVYLLVISGYLPQNSDNWPFIGLTFVCEFFLLCLALAVAEYSVHLAHRKKRPPPAWLIKLKNRCKNGCIRYIMPNEVNSEVDGAKLPENEGEVVELDDMVKFDTSKEHKCYKVQWKECGKFLDIIFSLIFLILIFLVPLIVAGAIR